MAKYNKEQLADYRRKVLEENRGRPRKIPYETSELRKMQKVEAAKAYARLSAAAQSVELKKKSFNVWQELNRWLYEVYHGRPKVAMEGEVKVPVQITFTLANPEPLQIENERYIEDKSADITDANEID